MLIALALASLFSITLLGFLSHSAQSSRLAFLHSCMAYVAALSVIYGADAAATIPTGEYRVVYSAGMMTMDRSAVKYVLTAVIWTIALLALIAPFIKIPIGSTTRREVLSGRLFALAIAVVVVLTSAVVSRGLGEFLSLRAQAFSESKYALPALFLGPPVAALSIFAGVRRRQPFLVLLGGAVVLNLAMVGSRTSVFIGVLVPLIHFYITSRRGPVFRGRLRPVALAVLITVLGGLGWMAASTYSSVTRASAAAANASWYNGSDFSSFDAFVDIVQNDVRAEWSFVSALFRLVPVAPEWAPDSGGTQYSLARFPERLSATGSAATPSLLGEMFMNFGALAPLMAALVLVGVCVLAVSGARLGLDGDYSNLFRLLVIYRGVNLIRGDLHDSVIGIVAIFVVFLIGSRRVECGAPVRSHPGAGRQSQTTYVPET